MDLVLIGGVSGSGKSVALGALEDTGYEAVNNLPLPLVEETAAYLHRAGRSRVAIALDVKNAEVFEGLGVGAGLSCSQSVAGISGAQVAPPGGSSITSSTMPNFNRCSPVILSAAAASGARTLLRQRMDAQPSGEITE